MQRDGLPDEFDRDREDFEDAQQRFEYDVMNALGVACSFGIWSTAAECALVIEAIHRIAPHVAAAIDAAAQQVIGLPEVLPRGREKALAVLRGGSRPAATPETPTEPRC